MKDLGRAVRVARETLISIAPGDNCSAADVSILAFVTKYSASFAIDPVPAPEAPSTDRQQWIDPVYDIWIDTSLEDHAYNVATLPQDTAQDDSRCWRTGIDSPMLPIMLTSLRMKCRTTFYVSGMPRVSVRNLRTICTGPMLTGSIRTMVLVSGMHSSRSQVSLKYLLLFFRCSIAKGFRCFWHSWRLTQTA